MKEIGGYFGLDEFINNEYYKDLISLNTGRNALLYLIKAKKIDKLYIPYYLCNSISDILKTNEINFEYYHINEEFNPEFNEDIGKNEFVYIVNYYGQLSDEKILLFNKKFNRIILDNTHAFFQKPLIGIDTIYSCRKFFGVPDGAYLSTDTPLTTEDLTVDISKDRMTHILGRFEGTASEYYNNFKENDMNLKCEPLKYMSKLTKNILRAIDYNSVIKKRTDNFMYLYERFHSLNKLKIKVPYGPFSYPFYTDKGFEIRRKLIEDKIYIPILWPNVLVNTPKDSIEYIYAANILPLPCDQRYSIDDMKYLSDKLEELL